jgi:spermidine synthase
VRLPWLLALSGAAALLCEVVWLRRLTLLFGSTGLALSLTLAVYMGGLGLGGWLGGRRAWRRPPAGYGLLELLAAGWACAMPLILSATVPLADAIPGLPGAALAAILALGPPAVLHGATLPAAAGAVSGGRAAGGLYAANTAGAVLGVLAGPLLFLPSLGLRGTELVAAGMGASAGLLALALAKEGEAVAVPAGEAAPLRLRLAVGASGAVALALEVCWSRLGALLLGGSVYAFAAVLAIFLLGTAAGAALGRRLGPSALGPGLVALGLLALLGSAAWRFLPHGLGLVHAALGPAGMAPGGALLLALAMGGAPVASGLVFTAALASIRGPPGRAAGSLLAANTVGAVLGSALTGLWGVQLLGLRGVVALAACLAVGLGMALLSRWRARAAALLALGALLLLSPRWDPALYSVGVYLKLDQFADLSPRAVERFAHEGFRLLSYRDGRSASVAVGESERTGVRWLSINGKVDASTGADVPTQILSGRIPVQIRQALGEPAPRVLVVGLASGMTAQAALAQGAGELWVLELEPEVARAAAFFEEAGGGMPQDPRAHLVVDDARAWLRRRGDAPLFDVIISEPSNPWLTGVSNLFTREYWELGRSRLGPEGVFCQWVQLYALPPEALRGLVRTYLEVFPESWLYETIPGADALLISGPPPDGLELRPVLDPAGLRRLAAGGRRNTDDLPWVEFEAPRWLHRRTATQNEALIRRATGTVENSE